LLLNKANVADSVAARKEKIRLQRI
jgi:hypothetical protein